MSTMGIFFVIPSAFLSRIKLREALMFPVPLRPAALIKASCMRASKGFVLLLRMTNARKPSRN